MWLKEVSKVNIAFNCTDKQLYEQDKHVLKSAHIGIYISVHINQDIDKSKSNN